MKLNIFDLDRRIIYALLLVALMIPLIKPFGLPIPISSDSRDGYNAIDKLPTSAKVLVSFDYGPSSSAELNPQAEIILKHLAKKGIKTYTMTTMADSDNLTASMADRVFGAAGKKYGTDYVHLGFAAGAESGVAAMSDAIGSVFKTDGRKTAITQIPIMADVTKLSNFDLVVSLNVGDAMPTAAWVRQAFTKNKLNLVLGVAAVMAPGNTPYIQSKQVVAMLTGLKGAAEYEMIMEAPGSAAAAMDAQSIAHLLIILLIVLGNIGYYQGRKAKTV